MKTTSSFLPAHDWLLIRRINQEGEKRQGAIYLAGATDSLTRGIVLATGPGRVTEAGIRIEIDPIAGDTVFYREDSAIETRQPVKDPEGRAKGLTEVLFLVRFDHILGFLVAEKD